MESEKFESYDFEGIDKIHIENLLDWLKSEILRSAGDGDSAWLCRFFSVESIFPLVQAKFQGWEIILKGKTIICGRGQESLLITNDEIEFNNLPSWIQAKIRW